MNAHIKSLLILAAFAMSISACSLVESRQIVGSEPVNPDITNGSSWVNSDGDVTTVTFDDKEPGNLRLTSKDEDSDEMIGYLRKSGDWLFLNLESSSSEDGQDKRWLWCVAKLSDDGKTVFFWMPNTEGFAKLVREGRVKGTVAIAESEVKMVLPSDETKKNVASLPSVTIDDPEGSWVEDLVSGKLGVPINWQSPILWRRVEANEEARSDSGTAVEAEQAGTGQPATRPDSKSEGVRQTST
jgi:hypothetical protein